MAITEVQTVLASGYSYQPLASWDVAPTAGDLLVVHVMCGLPPGSQSNPVSISLPGWTVGTEIAIDGGSQIKSFYKTAGASEPMIVQATMSAWRYWHMTLVQAHSTTAGGWIRDKGASANGISTSPSTGTTATTTIAEEYWLAGIGSHTNRTMTSPTNSFTIKEQQALNYHSFALLSRIVAATGAASTGGTYSASTDWTGLIDTFGVSVKTVTAGGASLSGYGTLAARAYYPTPFLSVAAAFGYGAANPAPLWIDISSYRRTFGWQRGRQNELNQLQAGTANLVLNDPRSHFDPSNTQSPFYGKVKPGLPVRVRLYVGASVYDIFYGFAERLPRTTRVANVYTERHIDLVDGFAQLAYAGLAGDSYPQQTADARVVAVLNNVGWPTNRRRIGTATTTLGAVDFTGDDSTQAQAHLQAVDVSEAGLLFVDGGNNLVFIGRAELAAPPYTVSQATYGDVASAGVYQYLDLVPSYDLDQVFNRWTVTRPDGSPQTAEDTTSQAAYFLRAQQLSTLHSDDTQAATLAALKLARFKDPFNRIETLTIMPLANLANTAQITAGLARELGDRITIKETPPGFTAPVTTDYIIQQIAGEIIGGPLISTRLTFTIWPA